MMRICFLLSFAALVFELKAQIPNRYLDEVFADVVETNDVRFSTDVPQPVNDPWNFYSILTGLPLAVREYQTTDVNLEMDIFEPEGDVQEKRPLVIICFGGGFVQGSREYWSMRLLAQGLARRGYVAASIDYRLGMNLFDADLGARAVYRGVQDSRSAIRFFRANADLYHIDPDKIFIGGHSAGAFIALHNLYLDTDAERPVSTRAWSQSGNAVPDQGCLDCVGDNLGFSGKANGVFSLAGAVGDVEFLENGNEAPPILFHSSDDGTVPYNFGEPFSDISGLIVGSDLPVVYGSLPISNRCTDINLTHQFNSYTNRGHGVHENGTVALHNDILPEISSWFYEQHLKPQATEILGMKTLCTIDNLQEYQISSPDFTYFDWQIEGGTFVSMSTNNGLVSVNWDGSAENHQITLTPYLCNGAQGDLITFDVSVIENGENTWVNASGGNWSDIAHWNQGYVPLSCEEVIIPNQSSAINVVIGNGSNLEIEKLTTGNNVNLILAGNAQLKISE